jgi:lysophospholipase L1-like esterase
MLAVTLVGIQMSLAIDRRSNPANPSELEVPSDLTLKTTLTERSEPIPSNTTTASTSSTTPLEPTPTPTPTPTTVPPEPTPVPLPTPPPTPIPTLGTESTTTMMNEPVNQHPYAGVTWYAIGDSITEQRLYPNSAIPLLQFSNCIIDAYGGRLMSTMGDRVNAEVLADVQLVTVFGGTNDYGKNTPLGSIHDNAKSNTFYGHLYKTIQSIQSAKPDVEIILMTPLVRGEYSKNQPIYPEPNSLGHYLEDYVAAVQNVANQYGLEVVDLFRNSGIDLGNLDYYTVDNLHPNSAGAQKIAEAMQRQLES